MGEPILDLGNAQNWDLIYNETLTAGRVATGGYFPLQPHDIPILLSSSIVIVEAENLDAKPWWFLGCRLQQVLRVGTAPDRALGSYVRVPVNRPRLFRFPKLTAEYSLRAEVPPWFERMKISIFEYTGSIGDTTEREIQEQSDLIRVDLARIEAKIN